MINAEKDLADHSSGGYRVISSEIKVVLDVFSGVVERRQRHHIDELLLRQIGDAQLLSAGVDRKSNDVGLS